MTFSLFKATPIEKRCVVTISFMQMSFSFKILLNVKFYFRLKDEHKRVPDKTVIFLILLQGPNGPNMIFDATFKHCSVNVSKSFFQTET